MKHSAIAAAALALSASAFDAQAVTDVPKHQCGSPPEVPGRMLSSQRGVLERYNKELKAYQACMQTYLEERKADSKGHHDAANAAINEYNTAMKAINEAQKARE